MRVVPFQIYLPLVLVALLYGCSEENNSSDSGLAPIDQKSTFIESLPEDVKSQVLWFSDFEDNSFKKWEDKGANHEFAGGGIFNTDELNSSYGIENQIVHSGKSSSFTKIENAISPGAPKAIRLMRWTDKAWDEGGSYFPDETYYSVFFYLPEVYNPKKPEDNDPSEDGGWWNIFQFKSDNNAGSQPTTIIDLYNENGNMHLGLVIKEYLNDDSEKHVLEYIDQENPLSIPSKEWVHLEAYYKKDSENYGKIMIWQNGQLILEKDNFRSIFFEDGTAVWGIGNYTDYINGGEGEGQATIFFDDAIVSKVRIGAEIK